MRVEASSDTPIGQVAPGPCGGLCFVAVRSDSGFHPHPGTIGRFDRNTDFGHAGPKDNPEVRDGRMPGGDYFFSRLSGGLSAARSTGLFIATGFYEMPLYLGTFLGTLKN